MNENFENFANSLSVIGSRVSHLETTTSTMDVAWALATEGEPDGTVVISDHQSAGRYRVSWLGDNSLGHQVASGVYFYRIQANEFHSVKKLMLLK